MYDPISIALATLGLVGLAFAAYSARVTITGVAVERTEREWARACGDCIRIRDAQIDCSEVCYRRDVPND